MSHVFAFLRNNINRQIRGHRRHTKHLRMKKYLQIPLLLVALFLTSIPISAHDFEVDSIFYNITDATAKTVEVTYRGSSWYIYSNEYTGSVIIPSTVTYNDTTYSVTKIGDKAFQGTNITELIIADGQESMELMPQYADRNGGEGTFYGCPLKKLYLGRNIIYNPNKYGGYSPFYGLGTLSEVTISNYVSAIGDNAFYGCIALTEVTIPNSVMSIGINAFYGCTSLTEVNYNAENCVTMGSLYSPVFRGCTALKTINIGNNVKNIPSCAFCDCISLTSVSIPNSINTIGSSAFDGCTSLTEVNYNAENCVTMGSLYYPAFRGCTVLKTINIGNNVKNIPSYAFSGCSNLTSITIPNSVTSIGDDVFRDCTDLAEVNISDLSAWCKINFEQYDANPLNYAKKLKLNGNEIKELIIPSDITEIKQYAFYGCSGLTSVTIPNSVTSIGDDVFRDCTGLAEVNIPTSVKNISIGAFYGCNKLVTAPSFTTTQTTATVITYPITNNYSTYVEYNGNYYKNGDKFNITGLHPENSYTFYYGLIINENYCTINNFYFTTLPFDVFLSGNVTASSISVVGSYTEGDAEITDMGINIGSSIIDFNNKYTMKLENLDPNSSYTAYFCVNALGRQYSTSQEFTTSNLDLTTQEAEPTSTTSVRLIASTNCDATEGTGFEWRRYDAPDELPSSKVTCPVVDGELVGSLRGVKDDVYYKYRPYYTSSSGKTYYGDWVAFFTGDANVYFEPEVRTYSDFKVTDNSVVVKGYALEGTDVITAQGFEYWKTGTTIKPSSTDDRKTINASGISMSATLANLEYNSTYKYRAFVTTAKGTVYGDEVEFSTGDDPAGVGYIEMDSDEFVVSLRENPATGTAWVKISGTANDEVQYTITSMSGAVVATDSVILDGEWNAIDLNCPSGMYLLTINDGVNVKTLRLIVK